MKYFSFNFLVIFLLNFPNIHIKVGVIETALISDSHSMIKPFLKVFNFSIYLFCFQTWTSFTWITFPLLRLVLYKNICLMEFSFFLFWHWITCFFCVLEVSSFLCKDCLRLQTLNKNQLYESKICRRTSISS